MVEIILEGRAPLVISAEVVVQHCLQPGRSISPSELKRLRAEQREKSVLDRALRLVASRQRSEHELRQRLAQRCRNGAAIEAAIVRLRELGLLDDTAFAQSWTESRDRASPRSARMIATELRQKGVAREAAEAAAAGVDEAEAAYRAAARRAAAMKALDFSDFQQRLGNFLLRRGFSHEIAGEAVRRLWAEKRP